MGKNTNILLTGLACGLVASWVKAKAEPPLQKIGEEKYPPTKGELSLFGADVVRQPENMPPSILAKRVYKDCTGNELSKEETLESLQYIHYGLGAIVGITYAAVADKNKCVGVLAGLPAGAMVWALTHGSTVPALGLQGPVKKMPKSWWVWEFGSHLVFGVAMEMSRRVFKKLF